MLDQDLWNRISAVPIDQPGAALTFTDRLARENRWSNAYAKRVVEEYRRFAYLAVTSGHEVTPSDEVDQVWHLHLTYSRHYWGVFCKALGAPLHHGPTAGGPAEDDRYHDNYAATLASYERAFGVTAPADIWPPADIRFGDAPFMARVNLAQSIVVNRKSLSVAAAVAGLGAGMIALAASATASDGELASLLETIKAMPAGVWIVAAILFILIAALLQRRNSRKGKKSRGGCAGGGGYGGGGKGADGDGSGGGSGCGGGGCGGGCGG